MPDWLPYLEIPVPASQSDIEHSVALAEQPVPLDVQQLLKSHQGETPEPGVITVGERRQTPFGPILLVSNSEPTNEYYTYSVAFAFQQISEWNPSVDGKAAFFPFATDTANNWYCVDLRASANPIVFIDMSYGPNEKGAITPVASTATELLQKLHN